MKRHLVNRRKKLEEARAKIRYLVKVVIDCQGFLEWDEFEIEAHTDREALQLASVTILCDGDISALYDDDYEDFETGKPVGELTTRELIEHLRGLNEEQAVYYMKNLTTGRVLIDDTAYLKKTCGDQYEVDSDIPWLP